MIDIKWLRDYPEAFDVALEKRGMPPQAEMLLDLDKRHRETLSHLQTLQAKKNENAKKFGMAKRNGEDTTALTEEGTALKQELEAHEKEESEIHTTLQEALSHIPNPVNAHTPVGENETENVEKETFGTIPTFSFTPKQHFELGEALGYMDFEAAATLSGSRFVILKGPLARLERAITQFMLDTHSQEYGYEEVSPPLLVRSESMYNTGQLPKFGQESFKTTDDRWLIPTAEVSLTNLGAGKTIEAKMLPLRYVAHTPCFRSEAGAAGRDTRGMLRQHQFQKVELVSLVHPENTQDELNRMTQAAASILKTLHIPYKIMALCTGDIGFQSQQTFDIEAWMPGQNTYREISSCSACGDFQARRMNAKFRPVPVDGKKQKPQFLHTLNGSGLAVGRTLIAVMENYQQADGTIRVPDALKPYMNGLEVIT